VSQADGGILVGRRWCSSQSGSQHRNEYRRNHSFPSYRRFYWSTLFNFSCLSPQEGLHSIKLIDPHRNDRNKPLTFGRQFEMCRSRTRSISRCFLSTLLRLREEGRHLLSWLVRLASSPPLLGNRKEGNPRQSWCRTEGRC